MESPIVLTTNSNDDTPRVKLFCSFNSSIFLSPQDGKLRYVGGRVFREISDDDDVINMMEECDKLGPGDGFTRLKHRDSERRYVNALNSPHDEFQGVETPVTLVNLHHLTIPHLGVLQHQMEPLRSPRYYTPSHPGNDFTSPPSCSSYHCLYGNCLSLVDHQSQSLENVHWLPPSGENVGFPNNILHGANMFEVNNVCHHFPPRFHIRNSNDSRPFYNEAHDHVALGPTAYPDGHHIPLPYVHHNDHSHYICHRHEFGNELFHDQPIP
ncbi:hypothetical protein HanPI659440_Chr06g0238471 [Helianthus annuus]|nr:hypothetical protein HanPI659440_Chr06g0238471 [Helianthus annuus]